MGICDICTAKVAYGFLCEQHHIQLMIGPLLIYSIMLIPVELGDTLCDPICLPPYFEPISVHQLRDSTDFKLGLATSFCESIRSGCALKICPTLLPIFLPVVCLQVSSNCTSLVEVGCSMSPSFPIFLFAIVDMGVLAFPEVFTGFNAGMQLASLPPWILELFV